MPDYESMYLDAGYDNWDDYEANGFRTAQEVALEAAAREREMEEAIAKERAAERAQDAEYDYPYLNEPHSHGAFDH